MFENGSSGKEGTSDMGPSLETPGITLGGSCMLPTYLLVHDYLIVHDSSSNQF